MDGNRFNQICSQLMLWEQLQVEVGEVEREEGPPLRGILIGTDLPVLVNAFTDARRLLRELVDAAQADNAPASAEIRPSNSAPATPARLIPIGDVESVPAVSGIGIAIGEHISPCIPVAYHEQLLAQLREQLRIRDGSPSAIETLTEVCKAQAETIAALADSVVELTKN